MRFEKKLRFSSVSSVVKNFVLVILVVFLLNLAVVLRNKMKV